VRHDLQELVSFYIDAGGMIGVPFRIDRERHGRKQSQDMTQSPGTMPRKDRLRRVVILCREFVRNLAYYRSGQSSRYRCLMDTALAPVPTLNLCETKKNPTPAINTGSGKVVDAEQGDRVGEPRAVCGEATGEPEPSSLERQRCEGTDPHRCIETTAGRRDHQHGAKETAEGGTRLRRLHRGQCKQRTCLHSIL
jgi:hypothetical protein